MKKVISGQNTPTEATGGSFSGGNKRIYVETSLNYDKTFNKDHSVTGLLLYMQKESQLQGQPYMYKKQGLVSRGSYAYKNKYFLDASFGFTGSENFAPKHRFGFFPAIGIGYMLTNEEFAKNALESVGINRFKIRGSIGKTGNDQVYVGSSLIRFPYKENLTWSSEQLYFGMSSSAAINSTGRLIYEKQAFNPNIQWEIEEKRNFGIDLTILRGIDFTIDYFNNFRHNILIQRNTVSAISGLMTNPFQNYGKVTNKGFDASLNGNKKIGEFALGLIGTYTYSKNRILEMDEIERTDAYQNTTGTKIGQVDAWVAERLYTDDDFDITINPTTGTKIYTLKTGLPKVKFGNVYPGNIKYADLNNDGIIDDFDWTKSPPNTYPSTPEIIYGFGTSLNYKGIGLSVFFQGISHVSRYLNPYQMLPFGGIAPFTTSTKYFSTDRWTVDNTRQDALLPRLQLNNTNINDLRRSTWFVRDGSFTRLKNAQIDYTFNKKQLEKLGLSNLKIYILGQNLFVWDKIKFWDPEQGDSNDGLKYPIQRSFNFGLDITL